MNQQAGTGSSSSLRPRNRRLISYEGDYEVPVPPPSSAPPFSSPSTTAFTSSRQASPIPSAHPSRSASATRSSSGLRINSHQWGLQLPPGSSTSTLFSPGYFQSSWSSIQGIASTLLGSDIRDPPRSATLAKTRKKESIHPSKYTVPGPDEWGPAGDLSRHIAKGSDEDRLAILQARKREELLQANGHSMLDASGKHKRRISGDRNNYAPSPDESLESRVYLHHVQSSDTVAGVMIKYNCSQATFLKVNRFWPNDSIQIRKHVYLPVDACGARGRKVASPSTPTFNLLDDLGNEDSVPTPTLSKPQWPSSVQSQRKQPSTFSSVATSPSLATTTSFDADPAWTHDSWVQIDGFLSPVEIVRLPCRALGFFPPARRKSISYTDETPNRSPNMSPSLSPNHIIRSSSRTRQRSGSSATKFALRGPGGVGTLGIETRGPGPAPDKLNLMFPNAATRASFESATSSTSIENLGGKVEGWVRKIASKAVKEISGEGDLIELMESWDPTANGGDGGGEAGAESSTGEEHLRREGGLGSGRDDEEGLLRERFPTRKKSL